MNKPPIQVLSEDVINKIAAGEVVERPASVVKELLENSIDAQAKTIIVEVEDGGQKLIRVSDNGWGMTKEEINLALQRHSTSKIRSFEDLDQVKTLGFRGEALPSIASVSKLRIEPNPSGSGITVEVKDLFYNVPARKKFLKSKATEMAHMGDIVAKYALAFPEISFKFISDGKLLLLTPGRGNHLEAIIAVYGTELAKELEKVDFSYSFGKISGFAGRPTLSRTDKSYEIFFVNKRYVRNPLLARALEEAYQNLIPSANFPVGIIFLEIDPKLVDVNVHPTKREVRFSKTQEVLAAITEAVKQTLAKYHQAFSSSSKQNLEASFISSSKPSGLPTWQPAMTNILFPKEFLSSEQLPTGFNQVPVLQFKNTYLATIQGEELILIDQHAAHERIIYDRLSQGAKDPGGISSQTLLIPETIELSPAEAPILQENLTYLKNLGFNLEEFGTNSFLLRSIPAVASKVSAGILFCKILSDLKELEKGLSEQSRQEALRKSIACHSAVKAGDELSPQEVNQLILDLFSTTNPFTCPHGRPTMLRFTEEELAKKFKR